MLKRTSFLILSLLTGLLSFSQQGFRFSCTKDTTVAPCGQGCATLSAVIQDIRGQSNTYTINKLSGGGQGCFAPYVHPNNNLGASAQLTLDDRFGPLVNLGFTFTFFGSNYTQFVAGSNGEVSFDPTMADQPSGFTLPDNLPSTSYAKALIMGLRHDIDMQFATTSPTKRIQYQVVGTTPHRRWILSFYKVPTYSSPCWSLFENTHQIVLWEGTGIVEVFVYDRQPCTAWNQGRGMIGMQDDTRTIGITVPGRGALDPVWGSVGMNETWRFVPNTGVSLLKRVELVNRTTNQIVATIPPSAVTSLGNGMLKVDFPNICSPAGTTEYLVRPVYKQIDKQLIATAEIFGADTIRVHRAAGSLNVSATSTPATCATGGTVTVNVTPAASYQYRIDGGAWQVSNTFNNVSVGVHSVEAAETGGPCATATSVTVDPTNPLSASATGGATACPGTSTGSVTVTANTGTAPFQYRMGTGPYVTSNIFTGLAAGNYTFYTKDALGCTSNPTTATVTEGPAVTASATATPTSCLGASDGSVQVTATAGTGPFEYSMSASGPWQSSNTFSGLANGNYNFFVKGAGGCISPAAQATVNNGPAITANYTVTTTSCLGASDGTASINAVSGTGPFEYRNGSTGVWQTSNLFTGMGPGSYSFYMRNAAGCTTAAIPVTITPGNPLPVGATSTPTSCTGATDGSITVTNPSGTGPFEYRLGSAGAWQTSATFTALASGSYTVYTRNAAGCTSNGFNITINPGATLQANAAANPTSCAGAIDGSVSVTNGNGTGPFEYRMGATGVWQTSNNFSGLAPGTYNFYIRTATGCISPAAQATVTAGSVMQASATPTATTCAGANNGSVQVTALSGSGPFEYRMGATGAWQTSNTFTALAPGTYSFYAKAASGCISNAIDITVNDGPVVTAQATATATSCDGATDGSVTVTAPTGTGPFEYRMGTTGTWQTSGSFTGLASGSYTFYSRNANCTSAGVTVNVNAGPQLAAGTTPSSTSCAGATDGRVVVAATNGTGPFEYRMGAAGTWQTSSNFTGLAPGSYDFYVRNTAGCISPAKTETVSAGVTLQANTTPTSTSCAGATDGSVVVSAATGTGPFEYRMGSTGTWQTSSNFTGLAPGNYDFYVRNTAGCISPAKTETVSAGATLQANTTATSTSCAGATDGTVVVSAAAGTGPFEYRMGTTGTWQTSSNFTGLAPGNYDFYVRNTAGCISPAKTETVSAGATLQANTTATSTSCAGATDGTVVVSAATGTGPFEYRMGTTGTWQTSSNFTGLAPGNYDFYIRNAAGCISPAKQQTVNAGAALQASATSSQTSCTGANNGSVQVNATSGTPPFEYRMGATGAWQSSNMFTGLAAGTYTFYTKSGNCISNPVSVTVTAGTTLTGTSSKTDVSCFGGNNGTATIIPPGMAMAYTFSKDNFVTQQTSDLFTNLAAGSHTFWLKDNAGCIGTVNVVISQPTQLTAPSPALVQPKCNGGNDGKITINPAGGTSPYTYSLNGGAAVSANNFTVPAGTYSVVVTDSKGCALPINNIVVSEPAALSGSLVNVINASCNGGADGQVQLSASGGTAPYKYGLTGYALQTNSTFNVNPGSYTATVSDNNNCSYTLPTGVVVGLTNDMTFTPMSDIVICEGTSGQLQPVTNATQFVWKGPSITANNTAQSSITVKPVADTSYSVIATFGRCSFNDTVDVNVNPAPVADAGIGNTICFGHSDTLSATGGATYEWSPATYLTGNITGPNPIVSNPQKTTIYTLFVRDSANCRSLTPATVTITVTPPLVVIVNPIDTIGYFGDSIKVKAFAPGGSGYTWTPAIGLSNANVSDPVVFVTTDRIYKVMAITAAGCSGEGTFKLRAYKGPDIYVPTAFTPNGDGLNERVRPFSVGIEKLNYFRVFDRWGQLMYEYTGEKRGPVVYSMLQSNIGWDGTIRGVPLNTGTFVWVAEGVTKAGKKVFKKGSVTLIR